MSNLQFCMLACVFVLAAFFLKMVALLKVAPMVLTLFPMMSLFLTNSSASPELEKFFDGLAALNDSTVASILDSIKNRSCECVKSLVALTKDRTKMRLCKYWLDFIYLCNMWVNKPLSAAGISEDNAKGWKIVREMNSWPRSVIHVCVNMHTHV